jgi:MFS family permease
VTYFGLCINTLYFSYLIKTFRPKALLLFNLSVNILACLGVTLSLNYYLFVFFRVV